jgi:hypothetical protein
LLSAKKSIVDDRAARREALSRGFSVLDAVGVLSEAHLAGLLDFVLRPTNSRLSQTVEQEVRNKPGPAEPGIGGHDSGLENPIRIRALRRFFSRV